MTVERRMKAEDRTSFANGNGRAFSDGTPVDAHFSLSRGARQVSLRIPAEVLDYVDAAVKSRVVRIPRHTWLLEAIAEKLEREAPHLRSDHGTE